MHFTRSLEPSRRTVRPRVAASIGAQRLWRAHIGATHDPHFQEASSRYGPAIGIAKSWCPEHQSPQLLHVRGAHCVSELCCYLTRFGWSILRQVPARPSAPIWFFQSSLFRFSVPLPCSAAAPAGAGGRVAGGANCFRACLPGAAVPPDPRDCDSFATPHKNLVGAGLHFTCQHGFIYRRGCLLPAGGRLPASGEARASPPGAHPRAPP